MSRWLGLVPAALLLAACGGGGGSSRLAAEAVYEADALCRCTDFECTKPHMQALNRIAVVQEAEVRQLPLDARRQYEQAQSHAASCQDALRPK